MINLLILSENFGLLLPIGGGVLLFFYILYLSHKYKWRNKWNSYSYKMMKKWNLG